MAAASAMVRVSVVQAGILAMLVGVDCRWRLVEDLESRAVRSHRKAWTASVAVRARVFLRFAGMWDAGGVFGSEAFYLFF